MAPFHQRKTQLHVDEWKWLVLVIGTWLIVSIKAAGVTCPVGPILNDFSWVATMGRDVLRWNKSSCSGQTLTIDHMLLECAVLRESRDKYYTANSLNTFFETIPETFIVEFLWEAGFFYLMWAIRHSIQSLTWTTPKLTELFNFMHTTSDKNDHISSTTLCLNLLATIPPDFFCRG